MADYKINCEVINISDSRANCSGLARTSQGKEFVLGVVTPAGMCAKAYASIYPVAMAMRFTEEIPMEDGRGYIDVTCPDHEVVYRLSRIKECPVDIGDKN